MLKLKLLVIFQSFEGVTCRFRWDSDPRSGRWPRRGKPGGDGGKLRCPSSWEWDGVVDFLERKDDGVVFLPPVEKKRARDTRPMSSSASNGETSMLALASSFPLLQIVLSKRKQGMFFF